MKKLLAGALGLAMIASPAMATPKGDVRVSGQGTIQDGRTFNLQAVLRQDGTVRGHATIINRNFSGDTGRGPYRAQIDISCVKQLDDNTLVIGGFVRRSNDSNLIDAVFFQVQDNGKDDLLSRAFFWDDDPTTVGDPSTCQLVNMGDFPMEEVIRGNINVH
jgi:hypothetical protein